MCYFLNDMIILAEKVLPQNQLKLYKTIDLNWQSQCKEMPDTKYYTNMMKIVGVGMSIFLMA